jgi:hypothetical protein
MLGMTLQAGVANLRGIAEYFFDVQKISPAIPQGFGLWIQGDRNCIVAFEGQFCGKPSATGTFLLVHWWRMCYGLENI